MKTAALTLKRKVLVIELPRLCDYAIDKYGIKIKQLGDYHSEFIEGSYTLLGSPDEIKEESLFFI